MNLHLSWWKLNYMDEQKTNRSIKLIVEAKLRALGQGVMEAMGVK